MLKVNFNMSWVDVFRLFAVAYRCDYINDFDKASYISLFEQLGADEQQYIIGKFGDKLSFLI